MKILFTTRLIFAKYLFYRYRWNRFWKIFSKRNITSIDSPLDPFIHKKCIEKSFREFLLFNTNIYYDTKKRLIARSIIEAWTRGPNRFLLRNYVKQWEEERERGRESSLFAALYVYWKIPEALFRSGKLVGEHLRQRLMRGMQFPQAEAARLSFDAPFPCTTPAPTRAFVLIRDREGGFEREFFGVEVRMLSWRKCAGNPIIYPERNRSLGSSILIRPWFERLFAGGKQQERG